MGPDPDSFFHGKPRFNMAIGSGTRDTFAWLCVVGASMSSG